MAASARWKSPVSTWGTGFSPAQVRAVLDRGQLRYHTLKTPELTAARMVADGLIIAWFQGRAEFGPRALGNRSIVADPRRKDMKDLLNATVKFREPFRPYAPSVLEESCGKYFGSDVPSPYMLRAYPLFRLAGLFRLPTTNNVAAPSTRPWFVDRYDPSERSVVVELLGSM